MPFKDLENRSKNLSMCLWGINVTFVLKLNGINIPKSIQLLKRKCH